MSNKDEMISLIESLLGKESESDLNSNILTCIILFYIDEKSEDIVTIKTIKKDI